MGVSTTINDIDFCNLFVQQWVNGAGEKEEDKNAVAFQNELGILLALL